LLKKVDRNQQKIQFQHQQ